MPYATEPDMIARYGEDAVTVASDRDGDGISDAGVIAQALTDASSFIDGYLAVRYPLPLAAVPVSLQRCCIDIALYQMSADCAVATDEQRRRCEDCMAFLRLLAEGKASLGLPEPPAADPRQGTAWFESAARRLTRDTLKGF